MPIGPRDRPHLRVEGGGENEPYTSPKLTIAGLPPARARAQHAAKLRQSIDAALAGARTSIAAREPGIAEGEPGFYLQFDVPAEQKSALDSLENIPKAIELVAVKSAGEDQQTVSATVFVPESAEDFFQNRIEAYRTKETNSGKPKHQNLITSIEDVRLGHAAALFTDNMALFPAAGVQKWWEVWVRNGLLNEFKTVAGRLDVRVKAHTINFPERDVVLALADVATIERLIRNSDAVPELRLAKDTPTLFLEMKPVEQAAWVANLAARLNLPGIQAPSVCVLDSGATQAHPLLTGALNPNDQHAFDANWGVGDSTYWTGHGTMMCGVALDGDLEAALAGGGPIHLRHRIETVKILPPTGQNEPSLYGAVTEASISLAERQAPQRRRVFCMAVTSDVGLLTVRCGRACAAGWGGRS